MCYHNDSMRQVLVRNLTTKTVKALKKRAALHRRSLQQELKAILDQKAGEALVDHVAAANRIRAMLLRRPRDFGDSGRDQAEDRVR